MSPKCFTTSREKKKKIIKSIMLHTGQKHVNKFTTHTHTVFLGCSWDRQDKSWEREVDVLLLKEKPWRLPLFRQPSTQSGCHHDIYHYLLNLDTSHYTQSGWLKTWQLPLFRQPSTQSGWLKPWHLLGTGTPLSMREKLQECKKLTISISDLDYKT